jgi:light-regulated signal transduction histidine kinase (bacteriophytochrome)
MLDKQVQRYLTELKVLVGTPDAELTLENPHAQFIHATAASGTLLTGLDAAVTAYQKDGEAKVSQLEFLIWWVSGSTLAAVAVTFWLAFLTVRGEVRLRASLEARVQDRTQSLALVNAELRRSNKELEKFAYVVSHDLKAPLRGISSLAGWIAEDYAEILDDEGRENLGLMVSRVQRMNDLIDGILRYSRAGRQMGRPESVDSGQLARDVIELLAPPDNVATRIEGTLPEVTYDRTQLEQVLQNLIGNGFKHMDKPVGEIVVSCQDNGHFWEFHVRDNGPGIPEEHFDRIFELFQTLKPRDELEATGVGLAVAKRIVERHGGSIHVERAAGGGSHFKFTVPKDCDHGKRAFLNADMDDARYDQTDLAG